MIYYLFTKKAWITPGNQPSNVNSKLMKKVPLKPCFKNTASGGNNILKIIVNRDIICVFWLVNINVNVKKKVNQLFHLQLAQF